MLLIQCHGVGHNSMKVSMFEILQNILFSINYKFSMHNITIVTAIL